MHIHELIQSIVNFLGWLCLVIWLLPPALGLLSALVIWLQSLAP